ncbi:hypothetical protein ABEB36_003120 [Hypothenemus hampei]|uniref:Uncharacterized protein n=1 Tax=Hypothenemus hampei TaxID=57062 RepID=A0ABD1F829_HYPHA
MSLVPYSDSESDVEDDIPLPILFDRKRDNIERSIEMIEGEEIGNETKTFRRRKCNAGNWKSVIPKRAHDFGVEVRSVRNKIVPARQVRTLKDYSQCKCECKKFVKIGNCKLQVCRQFYIGTLSISEKKVFNAHIKKEVIFNISTGSLQRKHRKRFVPEIDIDFVKAHINSFPFDKHQKHIEEKIYVKAGIATKEIMPNMF